MMFFPVSETAPPPKANSWLRAWLELVFSCPICFEFSALSSKLKASYNCRKSVVRKTLPTSSVDTIYRTLIISFLTVLFLCLYANLTFALQSAPWSVAQLLGLCEDRLLLHLLKRGGWHDWHQPSIKPV